MTADRQVWPAEARLSRRQVCFVLRKRPTGRFVRRPARPKTAFAGGLGVFSGKRSRSWRSLGQEWVGLEREVAVV